ncbi:MAG TPA: putative aminohydrolase SsnA [Verrucomicrobia bacterium]|nr:MAG: hypothetical protein A2X46_09535 [Lentisphaerae bacterium GWF2_57_35]HBA85793.1 putative aminohydrolase SsnA [Verrucomicrobiota bacterium]
MSSLLIKNGRILTLNQSNEVIDCGSVYIEGALIKEVGTFPDDQYAADRTIDAQGRVVMPGFINTHHHLYSSFARGFAAPGKPAGNFKEILESLWWKLDRALNEKDVYYSALLALMESIRSGCTTIVDHHASPSCRDGSLDIIEQAFREAGLNGCLCYEVSDRNRPGEGIEENARFIHKCLKYGDDQIAALFGLHAAMTLGPETLERCAGIGKETATGFHVHAAEDLIDEEVCAGKFGKTVMDRFHDAGITGPNSIFVHGVHLSDHELDILGGTHSILVHNPESNMNNAVGVTRILDMLEREILVGLGTDGMASHMISSARAAYLLQRHFHHDPRVGFLEAAGMLLKNNRAICQRIFREPRGEMSPGYLADVIVADYIPTTPLQSNTLAGHVLFGLNYAPVRTTICRGKLLMEDGKLLTLNEEEICARSRERAEKLWSRVK